MKISLNWLNDYVNISDIEAKDIMSRFSLVTAEIEGFEVKGEVAKSIIVAEVKTCEKIEGTKNLSKLTVWDGKKEIPVVCGAPNVLAGLKIAFAPAGTTVGDLKLEKIKLAGCDSHGMCCSGKELGFSNDNDGILELDSEFKIGSKLSDVMPFICDTIFEIDNKSITNRPDLWGHYGIARELSVIFGRQLKPIEMTDLKQYDNLKPVSIKIESDKCNAYGAIRVDNVTVKTTPIEMAVRLHYLDVSSHGFMVDLSNYIMMETGQPNHAFDAGKIGKISIGNGVVG